MLKEFEFIDQIRRKYALEKIGDDCAVLPKNDTHDMLISSDLLVEEIDFRLSWATAETIGHKALAVSLSDIAAMGGTPLYAMLSLGIPNDIWQTDFIDRFYQGWFRLARKFNVELIGGDVSKTIDKIVIDSTAVGEVEKGKAILRSGAKAGDLIFVTNKLGGASAGLKLLEDGVDFQTAKQWQTALMGEQLMPDPQISSGKALIGIASSMIDISDGLSSDLMHICEASQVGARIFAEKIPLHNRLGGIAKIFSEQLEFALNGGEDFELLFTVDPKEILQKKFDRFFRIGEVTANAGMIELIESEKSTVLTPKGFQHF